MPHAEIRVQNDPIHAIVTAAQQILIESAQPIRHGGRLQIPYPSFKLPRRGHFFAATSAKKRRGLRIGLISFFSDADKPATGATRQGIAAAVRVFEHLGCSVRELRLSPLADWAACGIVIMLAEGYAIHETTLRQRFTDYGEAFRDRMALAALITGADYVQATRLRRELV